MVGWWYGFVYIVDLFSAAWHCMASALDLWVGSDSLFSDVIEMYMLSHPHPRLIEPIYTCERRVTYDFIHSELDYHVSKIKARTQVPRLYLSLFTWEMAMRHEVIGNVGLRLSPF